MSTREIHLDRQQPPPEGRQAQVTEDDRGEPRSRAERMAEAQQMILATYADTFRRLAG